VTNIELVTHLPIVLRPDPSRVVIRPFMPADDLPDFADPKATRVQRIADEVTSLDSATLEREWARVSAGLADRHREINRVVLRRFHEMNSLLRDPDALTPTQALLTGAYFSEEYSFEGAALFNPSIVAHPDQTGVTTGALRFILSLRGVGEGHISSVTFRTGIWTNKGGIVLDDPSKEAISPRVEVIPGGAPDDPGARLHCDDSRDLSDIVIYPVTASQRQGIEDLRLVRFVNDDDIVSYLGTYTAFSGPSVRQELLRTTDFSTFELSALRGDATSNKGMALFPRKLAGRYAMLSRQDHINVWLLTSDDLYKWEGGTRAITPRWPWEFIQIGNCGSPIEIAEGWLVVTHGVGAVRNYCLGACLLDKDDPTKVLARMTTPLLRPNPKERDGYVPNVIYSCGAMIRDRTLLLPYAVADSFTTFASVDVDLLLAAMA
jgi:predicted GH43/DUF377 family glycosyl hydrolase